MPLIDREALRGLVQMVVRKMQEDAWRQRQEKAPAQPVVEDDKSPGIRLTADEEAILDLVMEQGTASTGTIAEELGLRTGQAGVRCQRMRARGLLEVAGHTGGDGLRTRQTVWKATRRGERSAVLPNPGVWLSRPRKEASA